MAQTTDPSALSQSATCLDNCLPASVSNRLAVLIWVWCQANNVSTDPSFLLQQASCLDNCLPPSAANRLAVLIYVASQGSGGGGGGGGTAQLVTYTAGNPANPPDTTKPALAYDPTGNLPTLGWNTSNNTWN